MKNVVKCLVMAAAVAALSIVSYRAGYEQAIKDKEIEAAILSLDNLSKIVEKTRDQNEAASRVVRSTVSLSEG
tara:strand:- start:299 stop:517 length:219 start_codon:yes stop_codon:yes gene_type:complete